MPSPGNARKPQIWPVSLHKSNLQTATIIKSVLKVVRIHHHAKLQDIPSMRSPGNSRIPIRTDGRAEKRLRLVGWTNGPMHRWKDSISGSGRMDGRTEGRKDGRTDGKPENIIPPVSKGEGITTVPNSLRYWKLKSNHLQVIEQTGVVESTSSPSSHTGCVTQVLLLITTILNEILQH